MIPLSIYAILDKRLVEVNRVEYKAGWNPSPIIHTICAFANDYCNVNGGYLIIGCQAENGIPVLPPVGIPKEELDDIQNELFQYCNSISPRYIPNIEIVDYKDQGIYLLYLKCSSGDAGPYQAPVDVYGKKKSEDGKNNSEKTDKTMKYWIRPAALTTAANSDEIAELYEKFNAIPYDDRICRNAKIDAIRRTYIEDFLRDTQSSLAKDINSYSLEDLLLSLEVANETDTGIELRNIAVLMFSDHPEKIIPGAEIELVWFHNDEAEGSNEFTEKVFQGPIWKQVKDVLDYINNNVIMEKVVKVDGKAEANRL